MPARLLWRTVSKAFLEGQTNRRMGADKKTPGRYSLRRYSLLRSQGGRDGVAKVI